MLEVAVLLVCSTPFWIWVLPVWLALVRVMMELASLRRTPPAPEIKLLNVAAPLREKASVAPEAMATAPVPRSPVVPPLPAWRVPTLMLVPPLKVLVPARIRVPVAPVVPLVIE